MAIKTANNQSMSAITALPSGVSAKSMILLATETASSSDTISFTSNIDSTYKEYIFKFINIHPANNDVDLTFNGSTDTGSNYNVTKTTTMFHTYHDEADNNTALAYDTSPDLAQSTAFQVIHQGVGNGNDNSSAGFLHLYDPSNTTFVKNFMIESNRLSSGGFCVRTFIGGYFNTTSAIDAVEFKMSGGNMDAGTIKMYGVL